MNPVLLKIASMFINKKRVAGWIGALAIAGGAIAAGMNQQELKDAVCGAPLLTPVEQKQ